MSDAYQKLIKTLRTVFEMDKADLDFGIYRILNQKREEITQFLNTDLLPQVKAAFADYAAGGKTELEAELQQAIEQARSFGVADPENAPPVLAIKAKLATAVDMIAVENEVYSHLHTFFSRYYDKGDFISQRRYKANTYAIPYEGEEVKLYWANHDQYYIKSSERLRDYAFTVQGHDGKTVRIKLVEADTEKDNVKAKSGEERRFVLDQEQPLNVDGDELQIRFHYVPTGKKTQDALNQEAVDTVFAQTEFKDWLVLLKATAPTEKNPKRTVLEKHLNDYTARHTFDYFIHKDLGGFLRRELDFYIKNEVLYLDDIDDAAFAVTEQHLRKIKVIRAIALKLIRMLAQLEDFQKKLWLKKKFVVETQYCITLDRVPEALYPEIAANQAQHDEWVNLFAINEIKEDLENPGYAKPLTVDFLKANDKLVLDTRFFDEGFKDRLLASIEDFDEQCDGLLIYSENFQALNLLQERYREQVKCIYIDPPYNTNATPILYKNEFKSASWLTLIENRVVPGFRLLKPEDGFGVIAIDDHELTNLSGFVEQFFPSMDLHRVIVNHYPGSGTGRSNVTRTHEYALFITPKDVDILRGEAKESGWRERGFCRSGTGENNYRTGRPNSFYAVLVDETKCEIVGFEPSPHKDDANYPTSKTKEGYIRIYPLGQDGSERCWTLSYESAINSWKKGFLLCSSNLVIKRRYHDEKSRNLLPSVWLDKKYSAVSHGTNLLTSIFGNSGFFSYPKSLYTVQSSIEAGIFSEDDSLVMDFFSGSGTTGHAVINLNRINGTNHQYILIEVGEYFQTTTKPRIQKVVYSESWNDGKPVARNSGISHCFKYLRLESYEDALNNLILKDRTKPQQNLLNENPALREDYLIGYWLDVETADSPALLNIDQFEDPFNYRLNIATGSVGAFKSTRVDLVETFNYLIGLRVKHIDTLRGFKVVIGANPKDESVLIVWRNIKDQDNAALEAFLDKQKYNPRDTEFDHLYVNGDHTLDDPHSKVKMIESEFKRLMFDTQGV